MPIQLSAGDPLVPRRQSSRAVAPVDDEPFDGPPPWPTTRSDWAFMVGGGVRVFAQPYAAPIREA